MTIRTLSVPLVLLISIPAMAFVDDGAAGRDPRRIEAPRVSVRGEKLAGDDPSPAAVSARGFLERHGGEWDLEVDRRTARVVMARGSGVPLVPGRGNSLGPEALAGLPMPGGKIGLETLEPLARSFIHGNASLLEPSTGRLALDRETSVIREDGRLASLYFAWSVDEIPVEGAAVFVRLNSGNITQFGAPLVGETTLDTTPAIGAREAVDKLIGHSGDAETYRLEGKPELVIQPEDRGSDRIDYRLIWKITYTVPGRIETWEGRVDAQSGAIVGFRDTNYYASAVGGIYPRTVFDDDETVLPLPLLDVTVDGNGLTTDRAGSFPYAGGPISTGLNGQWFNTSCQNCSTPAQPGVTADVGIGWADFGRGGQDEIGNGFSTPADRNSFYHLNQVRRIGKKWLPGLGYFAGTMTSNVNIENVCNAVYTGSVNFYRSGGGCNNTGEISDVMHHEWGHGLDLNTRSNDDGGTGEGTADVTAMHMSHSPLIGPGFHVDGDPVRNIDRNVTGLITWSNAASMCGGTVHCVGQVYGQAAWELAQALVRTHGHHTGWRISERIFFTSLPDSGGINPASSFSIYDAYLNADDDDGNLANGTPNADEIFTAFDLHEMAGDPVPASPQCARPAQPVLTVTPRCDAFDLSWNSVAGAEHYELLRAEVRVDSAFFPVTVLPAGQTGFTDTEVAPGVDYWYVVLVEDASGCESTVENPVPAKLPSQPILTVTAAVDDDTPRGNRSGFADPGEEVDLHLTLSNFGEVEGSSISGTIVSSDPGVTILEGASTFPSLPVDGEASNEDVLRFKTDAQTVSCGDLLHFEFVPDEASGCASRTSFFEVRLGEFDGGQFVCDDTPPCFLEPDFDGLQAAVSGSSCAEIELTWSVAVSQCTNAVIAYNLYRDLDPGFAPGPGNLLASGLTSTAFVDTLLQPGQTYHYVVRADDSRSGEESNSIVRSALAPSSPDLQPPIFAGLESASTGEGCGETVLDWSEALESCSVPVAYEIHRSTDAGFVPGPATLIGSTLSVSFVDAALVPGVEYTYVVRARDGAGNEAITDERFTVDAAQLDQIRFETRFEPDGANWSVISPNDAETGNWEWGDPELTAYQPDDDATPDPGVNCWITGLDTVPSNNDVDGGTTTLLSASASIMGAVDPVVRYSRYFTNDRGASPGDATDSFVIEVSNDDGVNWTLLEEVGAGTPLDWVPVEIPLNGIISATHKMRFRFTAADLGAGSLVEAGIDDFSLVDRAQGCMNCPVPVPPVGEIALELDGDDVVLDWSGDPVQADRFAVYKLVGPAFGQALRVGTTGDRTFVHQGGALASESFYYRVSAIDACGGESGFSQP